MLLSGRVVGRQCVLVTLLSLALSLAAAPGADAVAYEPETSFCDRQTLHDYLAPLERMPKLHRLPRSERMSFAGGNVRIQPIGESLAVGGGTVGFGFSLRNYNHPAHPRWDVTATLWKVDWRGRVIRQADETRRRLVKIGRDAATSLTFTLPEGPAVYRASIVVRSAASGRKLGGFGSYYRVVKPTVNARLALEASSYRPESTLFARIENYGTAYAFFGAEYTIERLEGETWVRAPESPKVFILPLYWAFPGTSSEQCLGFHIPASMAPGTYRMAKNVDFGWPGLTPRGHKFTPKQKPHRLLVAEFTVVP